MDSVYNGIPVQPEITNRLLILIYMIMNRKIFTLLAGTFLMLFTVFSAIAQGPREHFINKQPLKLLGAPVDKLVLGANDYYHLKMEAVSLGGNILNVNDIVANYPGNEFVLYMGNQFADQTYPIFISQLGKAGESGSYWGTNASLTNDFWFPNDPGFDQAKSLESASSLWCTVVRTYDQGQNIAFDFTNKFHKGTMLDVDNNDYESWGRDFGDGYQTNYAASLATDGVIFTPGAISDWHFSKKYATGLETQKPLFSYITKDTVAVLCIDLDALTPTTGSLDDYEGAHVYVKIAAADDVLAGLVPGMIYFTLYEGAPFVLDALDFNTMFATKAWDDKNNLKFNPDVNPATIKNLFKGNLFAEHIDAGTIQFDLPAQFEADYFGTVATPVEPLYDLYYNAPGLTTPGINGVYDLNDKPIDDMSFDGTGNLAVFMPITGAPSVSGITGSGNFDDFGYMYLKQGETGAAADSFLYAKREYYEENLGGDKFLTFGWRELQTSAATPSDNQLLDDYFLYGQSIWRLVYYPSGDSIYINPFQATYLPTWDADMVKTSPTSTVGNENKAITWNHLIAQASDFYTFRATHWLNMEDIDLTAGSTVGEMSEARLRYGIRSVGNNNPVFYRHYHHNYVTMQNLTGTVRVVTLGNGSIKDDHTIDTHINFGVYEPCKVGTTTRTTIPSDLYLIRNAAGEYLHVPFYSATDSVLWSVIEYDTKTNTAVHPELLPSYQWVVLKRYEGSETSQITIYNREFDGTKFNIQLYNTPMNKFDIVGPQYHWNSVAVNHSVTKFESDNKTSTFIALPKEIKENKLLGYEYIDRDTAQVNVYSLNLLHQYDSDRYINWKGDYWRYPNTDTVVYVLGKGHYNKLFFKLDTAKNYSKLKGFGFDPDDHNSYKIPYLVQLERQPYMLNFEDPYKLLCRNLFGMMNGIQAEYIMANNEKINKSFLGTPIFNLRHTVHQMIDGKLTPYFALAQRVNDQSYNPQIPSDRAAFSDYLTATYGSLAAAQIIAQVDHSIALGHTQNDALETGVFAAKFHDSTGKLMFVQRGDEAQIISDFRLVKNEDPIYRRFNSIYDKSDLDADDAPKFLKFYWMDRESYEMFENTGEWASQKAYWSNYNIGYQKPQGEKNYLGYINTLQAGESPRTSIYVDTAYINRGTGPVKPQYLLVVDPTWPDAQLVCDEDGNFINVSEDYLRGRFLINATDSARGVGPGVGITSVRAVASPTDPVAFDKNNQEIGRSYLWENNWERLVFTDAIHAYKYDALYLVAGVDLTPYMYSGSDIIDISKLDAAAADTNKVTTAANPIRKIFLGDNLHKDAVFQMRLIERESKQFIIESETGTAEGMPIAGVNLNRRWGTSYGQLNSNGPMIAPCVGAWIKDQNGPAVVSRSDMVMEISNGLKMDVYQTDEFPTQNDAIEVAAPEVIGGYNAVNILGAAGKKVVISNVLGQTVASLVLSSDNAAVAAPKGVVIVAIEGEAAVKTLVK